MATELFKTITLVGILSGFCASQSYADNGHHHSQHKPSLVGQPVNATKATKIVKVITSDDMRFNFLQKSDFHDGEIVTFEVTNAGKIPHEFSIGDEKEQKAHQEMMRKMPDMTHEHGNTITINPGETKTLTWQFKSGHEVLFSCNIPGHFEAGMYMKAKISAN